MHALIVTATKKGSQIPELWLQSKVDPNSLNREATLLLLPPVSMPGHGTSPQKVMRAAHRLSGLVGSSFLSAPPPVRQAEALRIMDGFPWDQSCQLILSVFVGSWAIYIQKRRIENLWHPKQTTRLVFGHRAAVLLLSNPALVAKRLGTRFRDIWLLQCPCRTARPQVKESYPQFVPKKSWAEKGRLTNPFCIVEPVKGQGT